MEKFPNPSRGNGRLIDCIPLPEGLRSLDIEQLGRVACELRNELIDSVSTTGGHFASSLGATEISVALHHLFDTPHDRIVWDIGHQAYTHKMLTGRLPKMPSIRQKGGISGYVKRSESEYDCFGGGHAGTSISAAVGIRAALQRQGSERHVVAVIGDGSMTCGMAFEAMNHAGSLGLRNFIVVLNDNEMSISANVGAISWLFSSAATSKTSTRIRARLKSLFKKGYVPEIVYKAVDRAEEVTQGFFCSAAMLFEAFGFRYIGPVDGHSIEDLVKALEHAKQQDVPVLVHAYTLKGKGYKPAEQDPVTWHGVAPFNRSSGQFLCDAAPSVENARPTYTAVFGQTLNELAREDDKIVAITAAMATGTGLEIFQRDHPDAFYDVGICEQHAVTFAAGLACEGYKPVCAIYSSFLQRSYDQIIHDVCIQNLPVVFAIDRAGAVGSDGETHQGVFDISYLRTLPNMVLMSPKDENELRHMLFTALQHKGPVALRYPRGLGVGVELDRRPARLPIGKAEALLQGEDALLICFGPLTGYGLAAAHTLSDDYGISCTVINARFAKPLDAELLRAELPQYQLVCTLEDHALSGGFGAAVLELISDSGLVLQNPLKRFGIGDAFLPHAKQEEQHEMHQYDVDSICHYILSNYVPGRMIAVG